MIMEGRGYVENFSISAVLVPFFVHLSLFADKVPVGTGMVHCNPYDLTNVQAAKELVNQLAFFGLPAPNTDSL